MKYRVCKECGCNMLSLTELYTAMCEFQHLIVDKYICLNCDCSLVTTFTIGYIFSKPSKHGDSCPQKHPGCFLGGLNEPAISDDDDGLNRGPTDLRDDWPHAISVPGGAWLPQQNRAPLSDTLGWFLNKYGLKLPTGKHCQGRTSIPLQRGKVGVLCRNMFYLTHGKLP